MTRRLLTNVVVASAGDAASSTFDIFKNCRKSRAKWPYGSGVCRYICCSGLASVNLPCK